MNTNVSGHQHIYLVQESYLPLAQYSEISSAIFSITKLAISGEGLSPNVTRRRTYVDGSREVSMLLHKERGTKGSFPGSNMW